MSNEIQNRYRQMFMDSQKSVSQSKKVEIETKSKAENGTIKSSLQKPNPQTQTIINKPSTINNLNNQNKVQNRYRQMFMDSQKSVSQDKKVETKSKVGNGTINSSPQKPNPQASKVTQPQKVEQGPKRNITPERKITGSNLHPESKIEKKVSKGSIKEKINKMIKTKTKNIENKKIQVTRNEIQEYNGIIDFFDKLTVKKFIKIMIIPCILAYLIGTFIGNNLGNLDQLFSKNKKTKEEMESQIKRNNEVVAEIDSEEEIIEEAKVETKNDYAYAYKFGNDMLEEKYGVTISYNNELESTPKTLKRTI